MESIQFIQVTPEQLEERIIQGIRSILSEPAKSGQEDDLLTRTDAAKFLQISTVTLWDWTNKGKLKSYGIANKIYYKKSELLQSLKPLNK